jgi:hypothetical protein
MKKNVNRTRKIRGGGRKSSQTLRKLTNRRARLKENADKKKREKELDKTRPPPPPPPGSMIVLYVKAHGQFLCKYSNHPVTNEVQTKYKPLTFVLRNPNINYHHYYHAPLGCKNIEYHNSSAVTIPSAADISRHTPESGKSFLDSLLKELYHTYKTTETTQEGATSIVYSRQSFRDMIEQFSQEFGKEELIAHGLFSKQSIDRAHDSGRITSTSISPHRTFIDKLYTFGNAPTDAPKLREESSKKAKTWNFGDARPLELTPTGDMTQTPEEAFKRRQDFGVDAEYKSPFDKVGIYVIYSNSAPYMLKWYDGREYPDPIFLNEKKGFPDEMFTSNIIKSLQSKYESIYILDHSCNVLSCHHDSVYEGPATFIDRLGTQYAPKDGEGTRGLSALQSGTTSSTFGGTRKTVRKFI